MSPSTTQWCHNGTFSAPQGHIVRSKKKILFLIFNFCISVFLSFGYVCQDCPGKRFLLWLGGEELWMLPWAQGPATTDCSSFSWGWSLSAGLDTG